MIQGRERLGMAGYANQEGPKAQSVTLAIYLTEMVDKLDRIENHLYNIGALPMSPPTVAGPLTADRPSICTRAEGVLSRLTDMEGAIAQVAFTLGDKLGGI